MKPKADSIEHQTAISVQKMRESDAYTIANFVSSREPMYRAALGVYQAVRSDLTVSIGFYKTGLFLGKAPQLIGNLVNADIGIVMAP